MDINIKLEPYEIQAIINFIKKNANKLSVDDNMSKFLFLGYLKLNENLDIWNEVMSYTE